MAKPKLTFDENLILERLTSRAVGLALSRLSVVPIYPTQGVWVDALGDFSYLYLGHSICLAFASGNLDSDTASRLLTSVSDQLMGQDIYTLWDHYFDFLTYTEDERKDISTLTEPTNAFIAELEVYWKKAINNA